MPFADNQVVRFGAFIDGDLSGAGAVVSGGAGRDARSGIDVRSPGSGLGVDVASRQRLDAKAVANGSGHRKTEDATAVADHEIDRFGRHLFGWNNEVPLVFAVLVIDEHNHAAGAQFRQGFFDGAETVVGLGHGNSPRFDKNSGWIEGINPIWKAISIIVGSLTQA